jgi:hypothetical protein
MSAEECGSFCTVNPPLNRRFSGNFGIFKGYLKWKPNKNLRVPLQIFTMLYAVPLLAKTSAAAATVSATSCWVCAALTNPASYNAGAK